MPDYKPIGYLKCSRSFHSEQPMQGNLSASEGCIELIKGFNYEQGLKDLEGFDHIWVIYDFHLNHNWRPLVNPPYNDDNGRKGVFATRSPYRPNQIGLSCVKLKEIKGSKIYIQASDLLNGTPVLDIKPYIPEYDSFPSATRGWLQNVKKEPYTISFSDSAARKCSFLAGQGIDLYGIIETQLTYNPFDKTRNKLVKDENGYLLRFKSWRIKVESNLKNLKVTDILSGYTKAEETNNPMGNDSAADLKAHVKFLKSFPVSHK